MRHKKKEARIEPSAVSRPGSDVRIEAAENGWISHHEQPPGPGGEYRPAKKFIHTRNPLGKMAAKCEPGQEPRKEPKPKKLPRDSKDERNPNMKEPKRREAPKHPMKHKRKVR